MAAIELGYPRRADAFQPATPLPEIQGREHILYESPVKKELPQEAEPLSFLQKRANIEARGLFLAPEIFEEREEVLGITIDGETTLDKDDAIWLQKEGKDYIMHVSIADPTALIKPDSFVAKNADEKAFTKYYKNGNNPMVPHVLSEDKLSLHEGQLRPTWTISMRLGKDLEVTDVNIRRTFIRSKKSFTYEEADNLLKDRTSELGIMLRDCTILGLKLADKGRREGAITFYDLEKGLGTSEEGEIKEVPHATKLVIQEFMKLSNKAVAKYAIENNIPVLFRNHISKGHKLTRGEIIRRFEEGVEISGYLGRAYYGVESSGHWALNIGKGEGYVHATSPLRRRPDGLLWENIAAFQDGGEFPHSFEDLKAKAHHINKVARAEKERREVFLKEKEFERARKSIEAGDFENLSQGTFASVLIVAGKEKISSPALEKEIIRRLEKEKLGNRDLYRIITGGGLNVGEYIVEWFRQRPERIEDLWEMFKQNLGWSVKHEMTNHGPQGQEYSVISNLTIGERKLVSYNVLGSSPRQLEKLTSIDLLGILVYSGILRRESSIEKHT